MSVLSDELHAKLSAFVDGELDAAGQAEVEALIDADPAVAAEVEALFGLNEDIIAAFDGLLEVPVPEEVSLPAAKPASAPVPANDNRAPVFRMAASLLLGAVLGGGLVWGALSRTEQAPVEVAAARSWLGEVAEYHQVYARQTRHLVEVPASEAAHLEKWLSKETGVAFRVPDLSAAGWTFQGGRLLVAAGKPVAQLLYTNAEGRVIALCALKNGAGEAAPVTSKAFGDVHMAVWKTQSGSFAIVGEDAAELPDLATLAAPLI